MKPSEKQLFETFWDHVRRAETDVDLNGHKGCPPPDPIGDPWDDEFAAAFDAIKPFLRQFRREHVFPPPLGMRWRREPMVVESAHQALMWFLNPPHEVYGHPGVLDSPEYLAIKAAAMEERRLRAEAREQASRKPKTPRSSTKTKAQVLIAFLVNHHLLQKSGPDKTPLSQEQISDALTQAMGKGWSQPRIHDLMEQVFKNGGMDEYKSICRSGAILKRGILKRYEDGTADIDAIVEDEQDD
jgi:uncharacterized protein YneF (UPF0154 family)